MSAEATYRAVQAVSPGKLELTRKPLVEPGPGRVRLRVEACGICHTDAATVEGGLPIAWPRVPGHELSTTDLLFGNHAVEGALTGDPATGDATLRFSVLTGIAAMIETVPLEQAPQAYAKMMSGKARFRMVLTT